MSEVILIRNRETKQVLHTHVLESGEKPWEVLIVLEKMDVGVPADKKEFVMDPDREEREKNADRRPS